METLSSLAVLAIGLLLRLAIPITGTILLMYFLRKLDAHWQMEAKSVPLQVEKVECWNLKGCSDGQCKDCIGATSPLPCWQAFRQPNGYLQEKCISCEVFVNAPIPALQPETRSM